MGSPWATPPKTINNFFSEITEQDPKLSKPFYFNKIPFWLSYECFSILSNAFLLKSAISRAIIITAVMIILTPINIPFTVLTARNSHKHLDASLETHTLVS